MILRCRWACSYLSRRHGKRSKNSSRRTANCQRALRGLQIAIFRRIRFPILELKGAQARHRASRGSPAKPQEGSDAKSVRASPKKALVRRKNLTTLRESFTKDHHLHMRVDLASMATWALVEATHLHGCGRRRLDAGQFGTAPGTEKSRCDKALSALSRCPTCGAQGGRRRRK